MLDKDFFSFRNTDSSDGSISAVILLNKNHPVYQGHFPEMPVVPGVCQIQIVKEVLIAGLEGEFLLHESHVCKFINMMNPHDVEGLKCEITWVVNPDNTIPFSGMLSDTNRTYFKIKGTLKKQDE